MASTTSIDPRAGSERRQTRSGGRARPGAAIAALAAVLLVAAPSHAQSVLQNGRFAGGLASWSSPIGNAWFSPLDADGSPGSGSAKLLAWGDGPSDIGYVEQCVNGIVANAAYYLAGEVMFPAGETTPGSFSLNVAFFTAPNCEGPTDGTGWGDLANTADGRGVWHELAMGRVTGSSIVAGPAAKSAVVYAAMGNSEGGGRTAYVDNILLGRVGLPLCNGLAPTIGGGEGSDVLLGTPGPDVIVGLDGDDTIRGRGGDDTICGGRGDDKLIGGSGHDVLRGDLGDDLLRGGAGNDDLAGGLGEDRLFGGGGQDLLGGGLHLDKCAGGGGSDVADASCETATNVP